MNYKLRNVFFSRCILILISVLLIAGCGGKFFSSDSDDKVELPTLLGYSVRVMEASKGLYDTILSTSAEMYQQEIIDEKQVAEVVVIANKYMAAHNTAQRAVAAWYNAHVNNEPGIDQTSVIMEVINLVSLAPEIIRDINEIAGTSFELPKALNIEFLINLISKQDN